MAGCDFLFKTKQTTIMLKDQSPTFHQLFEIGISSSIWLIFAHALDMALAGKKKKNIKS